MFKLNGKPISLDVAFTTEDGTQYPNNWLRLATVEERKAIGITEEPDPIPVDQRFYWDTGIPKDLQPLVEQYITTVHQQAEQLLSKTDWLIIREAETGKPTSDDVHDYRQAVRDAASLKIEALGSLTTVEDLIDLVGDPEYQSWPSEL